MGAGNARPPPTVRRAGDGTLITTWATPGAVVGWSSEAAPASTSDEAAGLLADPGKAVAILGNPSADGRLWQLVQGPVRPPVGELRVRAWRLGFTPSEEVVVPAQAGTTT